jgi:hypothetical protein
VPASQPQPESGDPVVEPPVLEVPLVPLVVEPELDVPAVEPPVVVVVDTGAEEVLHATPSPSDMHHAARAR